MSEGGVAEVMGPTAGENVFTPLFPYGASESSV
jgi:hypothetical protein